MSASHLSYLGCFPLCQRFQKFRPEFKWKGPFQFLLTGIFGIISGGGPHISVGIFRPKFAIPFLTSHFYWLAQFNQKMPFHFPQVFPLISDRSVWHNGKHPSSCLARRNEFHKGLNNGTFSRFKRFHTL